MRELLGALQVGAAADHNRSRAAREAAEKLLAKEEPK